MTQASAMALIVNWQLTILEGRVNKELRRAVGDVFEKIFQKGFGAVKSQFLKLLKKVLQDQAKICHTLMIKTLYLKTVIINWQNNNKENDYTIISILSSR